MKLSKFDLRVLEAIRDLQPNAYGVTLHQRFGLWTSLARIYDSLERLEEGRFIIGEERPGGPERGYRPKRMYTLTISGAATLTDKEQT